MNHKVALNGCDYLMLGFDHELRRLGYAGNSCQIILGLGGRLSPETLERRLQRIAEHWPILQARPGGVFLPKWKLPRSSTGGITLRTHRDEPQIDCRLVNEPLDLRRGELLRLDLIEAQANKSRLIFTWAHALMDAPSAEYLLALIGREDLRWPPQEIESPRPASVFRRGQRLKLAWKTLHRIDKMCEAAPRSMGIRRPEAPHKLQYRLETFSAEESERIRHNAVRLAGLLGAAQLHAAASLVELHRFHERLGQPSPSYILPLPVGLRAKGTFEPLFSNQVTMLMTQFLPQDLKSIETAIAVLKKQMQEALRSNLLESGRILSEIFRYLPLGVYISLLKQGLRGEICSLFYGDTAVVNPQLTSFLEVPIEDFAHVAAITPSPGLGAIFYEFEGKLRMTMLQLLPVISEDEAASFAAGLKQRLLEP